MNKYIIYYLFNKYNNTDIVNVLYKYYINNNKNKIYKNINNMLLSDYKYINMERSYYSGWYKNEIICIYAINTKSYDVLYEKVELMLSKNQFIRITYK